MTIPFVQFPPSALRNLLETVSATASKDASRTVITGVNLSLGEPGVLWMTATDGHAILRLSYPMLGLEDWMSGVALQHVTITPEGVKMLCQMSRHGRSSNAVCLGMDSGRLTAWVHKDGSLHEFEPTSVPCFEKNYPDYTRCIPDLQYCVSSFTMCREELLKVAQHFRGLPRLTLTFSGESEAHMDVQAGFTFGAFQAQEKMTILAAGGRPTCVSLNASLVVRALASLMSEKVLVQVGDDRDPVVFRATDVPAEQSSLAVVMPLHVGKDGPDPWDY